jgi:hypothetical protein
MLYEGTNFLYDGPSYNIGPSYVSPLIRLLPAYDLNQLQVTCTQSPLEAFCTSQKDATLK